MAPKMPHHAGPDGRELEDKAFYAELVPGTRILCYFPGDVWHERLLLCGVREAGRWPKPHRWAISTPDGDIYVEDVGAGTGEGPSKSCLLMPKTRAAPEQLKGVCYRFGDELSVEGAPARTLDDDYLKELFEMGRQCIVDDPDLAVAKESEMVENTAGIRAKRRDFFKGGPPPDLALALPLCRGLGLPLAGTRPGLGFALLPPWP